jgi:hypothetical protein
VSKTITPRDLRKPRNASGYRQVGRVGGQPSRGNSRTYFQAFEGRGRTGDWKGPARRTGLEAAQDYCDRVNGLGVVPSPSLKTAGHEYTIDKIDHDPEYQAALGVIRDRSAQRAGKRGYVYLIVEDIAGGGLEYGKIGYSTNPRKRVAELQTGNPRPLRLHLMKPGTEADERAIHMKYIDDNVLQEWFRLTKPLLLEWDAEHQVDRPERKAA